MFASKYTVNLLSLVLLKDSMYLLFALDYLLAMQEISPFIPLSIKKIHLNV